ncbi:MAG: type I DNA topoisomerase [Clostridia bacterium]|nr:type I DNA topoisomerase [Clostridia bacterium]
MARSLVIVESPAKARTIEKFLGRRFAVLASMGHVRDLPKSRLGIDVERGFEPRYITIRGKGPVIARIRDEVRKAREVLLATDPDREGEAISWHLAELLGLPADAPCRIAFHEVTARAVEAAVRNPRPIDMRLVDAQKARRVLDRLVGYKLSPLLWRKVRGGLSAGRVQSVAVRLVVDREAEIQAFQPEEYWTLEADLLAEAGGLPFVARYVGPGGKRPLPDRAAVDRVLDRLAGGRFQVVSVQAKERRRTPPPPFTTSTLQQEASRKLGFTAQRTMRVAQELYEGLEVRGEGSVGLITYMRTDSTRVAEEAQREARDYIVGQWGEPFWQRRPGAAGAQDAHEAIRPTRILRHPDLVQESLSRDQARLYRLVWERFVASQMAPAVYDVVTAEIEANGEAFRATGSQIKFAGFMVLYTEGQDEEAEEEGEVALPELRPGQALTLLGLRPEQHFTTPPPRYTEAMLVKALEEKGIGRPSTYAPIIETIQARGYVVREKKRFRPTELGVVVTELLKEHFPDVVDVAFTAQVESQLDRVESGEASWRDVVAGFYAPFASELAKAEEAIGRVELAEDATDEVCEVCGRPMVRKVGRFGPFLACSGYPECRHTKPIVEKLGVGCPECKEGQLVARRSKKGRTFYGCDRYPACTFVLWDRPTGEVCPTCGSLIVERRARGGGRYRACSNRACPARSAVARLGE